MSILSKGRFILKDLIQHLSNAYTSKELDNLIQAYSKPRFTSFRLNHLKCKTPEMKKEILMEITDKLRNLGLRSKILSVPWNKSCFIMSNADVRVRHLSNMNIHKEGLIHFQSLSSILPPLCLNPKSGETVLDMCSAPGGKSMQLLEAIGEAGKLIVNDIDSERMKRLYKNIDTLVPESMKSLIDVRVSDGRKLMIWENQDEIASATCIKSTKSLFKEQFDSILLDAPCSGEGIIYLHDEKTYKHWSEKSVKKCARIQAQLLDNAYHLLKTNGYLVYSTCTLSPQENEEIVQGFLDHYSNVKIVSLGINFFDEDGHSDMKNFSEGMNAFNDRMYDENMGKSLRIFPNEFYEGFFVCKMQKFAS